MDATAARSRWNYRSSISPTDFGGRVVDATEFRRLLISHRRMIRVDRRAEQIRGLKDLDTGEVFLIDERRLIDAGR